MGRGGGGGRGALFDAQNHSLARPEVPPPRPPLLMGPLSEVSGSLLLLAMHPKRGLRKAFEGVGGARPLFEKKELAIGMGAWQWVGPPEPVTTSDMSLRPPEKKAPTVGRRHATLFSAILFLLPCKTAAGKPFATRKIWVWNFFATQKVYGGKKNPSPSPQPSS